MKTDHSEGLFIDLQDAGKKYIREWVFRHVNLSLKAGEKMVLLGPNGSGKSTLLQLISGSVLCTEGAVQYRKNENQIDPENVFRELTIAAPYLELIEEFTLLEILQFHFKFKKSLNGLSIEQVLELSGLAHARHKTFKNFSSGMKQRIRLTLAILSESSLILLDEPCANLDKAAIHWYQQMVEQYAQQRTVLVCSNNQPEEYVFCQRQLDINQWKIS